MSKHENVWKRGGVISTITCLKRRGNTEQNIENSAVCRTLNGLLDMTSQLQNVGLIKT